MVECSFILFACLFIDFQFACFYFSANVVCLFVLVVVVVSLGLLCAFWYDLDDT